MFLLLLLLFLWLLLLLLVICITCFSSVCSGHVSLISAPRWSRWSGVAAPLLLLTIHLLAAIFRTGALAILLLLLRSELPLALSVTYICITVTYRTSLAHIFRAELQIRIPIKNRDSKFKVSVDNS